MITLSVRLFGTFEATLGEKPLSGVTSTKARDLLAYLAVEMHRPHSRDALAALLWPEVSNQAARSSLRGALFDLRQALYAPPDQPPFLCVNRETVQFNPASSYWLDVQAFQEAILDGPSQPTYDVERLQAASILYRGRFLEELPAGSAPFEEWALMRRELLDRLAAEALGRLAKVLETRGDYILAREVAYRLLELDPWREQAHQQVMRLLVFDGQRSAALAHYECCRRTLQHELGVEPSLETKQLYRQIRDDQLTPPVQSDARERMNAPGTVNSSELSILAEPIRSDRHQKLIRLRALLDAAMAGQSNLVFIAAEPNSDQTTHLEVHGLDFADLFCLREAVGQALDPPQSTWRDPG